MILFPNYFSPYLRCRFASNPFFDKLIWTDTTLDLNQKGIRLYFFSLLRIIKEKRCLKKFTLFWICPSLYLGKLCYGLLAGSSLRASIIQIIQLCTKKRVTSQDHISLATLMSTVLNMTILSGECTKKQVISGLYFLSGRLLSYCCCCYMV